MEIEVQGFGKVGGWVFEGTEFSDHGEDYGVVFRGGTEGDMEDRRGGDDFVDGFAVVFPSLAQAVDFVRLGLGV